MKAKACSRSRTFKGNVKLTWKSVTSWCQCSRRTVDSFKQRQIKKTLAIDKYQVFLLTMNNAAF